MFPFGSMSRRVCSSLSLAAVAMVAVPAALAQSFVHDDMDDSHITSVAVGQTDAQGRMVIVELQDGTVTSATVDGKKVDSERVRIDGDQIVIVGPDGKEIVRLAKPDAKKAKTWRVDTSKLAGDQLRRAFSSIPKQFGDGDIRFRWSDGDQDRAAMPMPKVMLGVTVGEVDGPLAEHFGLDGDAATLITGVSEGMAASKAGIKSFDIVVAIDGKSPAGMRAFRDAMSKKNPGDTVTFGLITAGQKREVTVALTKFDGEKLRQAFPDVGVPGDVEVEEIEPPEPGEDMPSRFFMPPGAGSLVFSGDRVKDLEKKIEKLAKQVDKLAEMIEKLAEKK